VSDAAYPRIQGDPGMSASYQALLDALAGIGDFEVRYRKGAVQLGGGGALLAVRPHTRGLAVTFADSRTGTEQGAVAASPTEVVLTGPDDVDAALVERIAASYRTVRPRP
jgi:hypothetical protein